MRQVGFSPDRHAGLQIGPGTILGLGIRGRDAVIPVIGGPIEFVTLVPIVHGVIRAIPGDVDECK